MEEKKVSTAAYTPFKTFQNVLEHLKDHGVPNIIDRSMFPTYSGTLQGQIIGALQFLGLINTDGIPSEELHSLVNANEEERKSLLKPVLEKHYSNLFEAGLTKITPSQFESLFSTENYGVSGDTRKKAKSFLFFALEYAGISYSKLLTQRTRSPRKKKSAPANGNGQSQVEEKPITHTPSSESKTEVVHGNAIKAVKLKESNKTIWLGSDANIVEIEFGQDLDFVLALSKLFKLYEEGKQFKVEEIKVGQKEETKNGLNFG